MLEIELPPDDASTENRTVESKRIRAKAALMRGDFEAARIIYLDLAAVGDTPAFLALGIIYEKGHKHGVDKDFPAALHWYERALTKGDSSEAALALGRMNYLGHGCAIDYKKAFFYYSKLDNDRFPVALLRLGIMYVKGNGVPKNSNLARDFFRRAAKRNIFALKNYGVLEVRRGNLFVGLPVWAYAFILGVWLSVTNPDDPRLKYL